MSAFTKFYFRPGDNELIETVVTMKPDERSAIHGYVRDTEGRAMTGALVILFENAKQNDEPVLVSQVFTDDSGQFIFGPLYSGRLYLIKVFKNTLKLRELEINVDADI